MSYRISPCQIVDGASGNASPIPVASTGVKYAKAIKLSFSSFFSISYQLASSGSPDVQIDLEHSVDGNPPVTEGSASSNFIVPELEYEKTDSRCCGMGKVKINWKEC